MSIDLIFLFLHIGTDIEGWNRLAVAYVIAYISFFPFIRRHRAIARADPDGLAPEARLYWLLWSEYIPRFQMGPANGVPTLAAPLETIGLFGFAWTSLGPPHVHWIAPLIFAGMVGVANVSGLSDRRSVLRILGLLDGSEEANLFLQFAIYMATIDYMVASYGPYAASATGGNALARDFLAGVAAMYSVPCKAPRLL